MDNLPVNQLIIEKLNQVVSDENTRKFIIEILAIEKSRTSNRGKTDEYERVLARYVRNEQK